MSRKRTYKTKAEQLHLDRVAALGCIICKNLGHADTPAEIHHCCKGTGLAVRADNHTLLPTQKRKQLTAEEYAYLRHHRPELTAEQAYRLAADCPRYKAIGNSMAVPVMRWIGSRIQEALRA